MPLALSLLCTLMCALLGAAMLAYGWDRGPDVLVDFGRELYVPWRLLEGDVLHRDIAWFNGPLAPWMLEGWMHVFGVSLDALQAFNAVVIACCTLLMVMLLSRATSLATGFAAGVTFLTVFAVAEQGAIGNFQFLSPYSHGITVGFLAGLFALEALARGHARPDWRWHFLGGLGAGAAFLTKAEVSLAVGAGCGVMLLATLLGPGSLGTRLGKFLAFQLGAAFALGAAYFRLHGQLEGQGVFRALLGTWPYALDERAHDLAFYKTMRGTDAPVANLTRMAIWTAALGAFAALALFVGGKIAATGRRGMLLLAFGGSAFVCLGSLKLFVSVQWLLLPLPILLVARGAAVLRRMLLSRNEAPDDGRQASMPRDGHDAARLAFLAFSLALLPKVLLIPMARQYGFVLAAPGTMVIVALLTHCLPHWSNRIAGRGVSRGLRWTGGAGLSQDVLRLRRRGMAAAGFGIVAVFCFGNFWVTKGYFATKKVDVGTGSDRLLADGFRGTVIAELVDDLDARMGPDDTLLVLPEGILVNYLLRRRTPTRFVNFMPPELVFFDEQTIVTEIANDPPDFVVLFHRPTDEYGYPFIGEGYGEPAVDWIRTHYREIHLIGDDPFTPDVKAFGASIMAPRD